MDLGLEGKVAIVTGGAGGIGAAVVDGLIAEGAVPVVLDRRPVELDLGLGVELELTDHPAVADAVATAAARFGRIDIVVNNAGFNDGVGLESGVEAFRSGLELNLLPAFVLVHHALPHLRAARGCIVNVTSKVATTGQGGTSSYAAAKGAINGLTREWAIDLAPHGIRVNAVAPAETMTGMYRTFLDAQPDPTAAERRIADTIPLGRRFTTPREIADTIVFLASQRASHTTGQILFVDGGYTHLDRIATVPPPGNPAR